MSSRPIDQPIMHPEALWDLAAIMAWASERGLDAKPYIGHPAFPTPIRLLGRGSRRWTAGDVMRFFDTPPKLEIPSDDHVLYRHFSRDGTLLYVGVSLSALTRLRSHKHRSSWFRRVTRIELERFSTRKQALAAEARAIATERPLYNAI